MDSLDIRQYWWIKTKKNGKTTIKRSLDDESSSGLEKPQGLLYRIGFRQLIRLQIVYTINSRTKTHEKDQKNQTSVQIWSFEQSQLSQIHW